VTPIQQRSTISHQIIRLQTYLGMLEVMTTSDPPALGVDLMLLLSRAAHALASEHAAALADLGVSPRAYCVLSKAAEGELTQIQLAEVCGLDKTTMVVTVDELETAGLAERTPSPSDRRARIVSATEAGRRTVDEGRQIVARLHEDTLAALPEPARAAFVDALARLVEGPLSNPVRCDPPVRRRTPRAP
jgi:DNA-binding MarR family transcriptional regulator